jgi:hypothetical protein
MGIKTPFSRKTEKEEKRERKKDSGLPAVRSSGVGVTCRWHPGGPHLTGKRVRTYFYLFFLNFSDEKDKIL